MGRVSDTNDNSSFGITASIDLTELANKNNKSQSINRKAIPSLSSRPSRSKVLRRISIHLIRFCLKSGIRENKNIIKYLEENEIFLTGRSFDRYKSIAERELEIDCDANIWLSEKTQNALVNDYKDISDRYDRQLALNDTLTQGLIMQAVDKTVEHGQAPEKYYRNLDIYSIIRIQEASNQTMKNKLELISKGFIIYKIKQYIDHLHNRKTKDSLNNTKLNEIDMAIRPHHSNLSSNSCNQPRYKCGDNRFRKKEYNQDYLDQYDLVIGMTGKPIKKHLAEIEKKFGKPASTIYPF